MNQKKKLIMGSLGILLFCLSCQKSARTSSVSDLIVSQRPQDPGPGPEEYQPGYNKLFSEWCKKYWEVHQKKEPDLFPEFEPDLSKKGEFFEGIYLDPGIPDSMYRALAKDLHSIRSLTFPDPDGEFEEGS